MSRARRVPWKRSTEPRDCGAAAFASIATYHGHSLSVEEARELVHTDRTGTSMRWICEAGRTIGLEARGARSDYDSLPQAQFPLIAHLDALDSHFVVVDSWAKNSVQLTDPSVGPFKMSRDEFCNEWSGLVVEFVPSPALVAKAPTFVASDEIFPVIRRMPGRLALSVLLISAATVIALVMAQQLGTSIDAALVGEGADLVGLSATLLALSILVAAAQLIPVISLARAGELIEVDLADRFLTNVGGSGAPEFEERCPVAFAGRVSETNQVRTMLTTTATDICSTAIVLMIAVGVLISIDTYVGLAAVVALPIFVAVAHAGQSATRVAAFRELRNEYMFLTRLVDTFIEFHTVKIFNAENKAIGSLRRMYATVANSRRAAAVVHAAPQVVSGFIVSLVTILVVVATAWRANSGDLSAGDAILCFGAAGVAIAAMQRVPELVVSWRDALLNLERLQEIIHKEQERGSHNERNANVAFGAIEFSNVSFGYEPGTTILNDVTFQIHPGETVALVGETGSGKTSIARLLATFGHPTNGVVRIDGRDLDDLHPADVREMVTVVFQDTRLLQLSIKDNLLVGAEDATEELLWDALELARVDDVVRGLRLGLETHASRAGRNLSSGQGQRLAIARAVLRDPSILVLDEATANVDSAIEAEVLGALLERRVGKTTILAAHRFATVAHADRVIVLANGRVAQQGTLQEVLEVDGPFRRLFAAQLTNG